MLSCTFKWKTKFLPNLSSFEYMFYLISYNLNWLDKDIILLSLVMSVAVAVRVNTKQL